MNLNAKVSFLVIWDVQVSQNTENEEFSPECQHRGRGQTLPHSAPSHIKPGCTERRDAHGVYKAVEPKDLVWAHLLTEISESQHLHL